MDAPFSLHVHTRGLDLQLEARLQILAYTHRFLVQLGAQELAFEPDEEGGYRVVGAADGSELKPLPQPALLQAVIDAIVQLRGDHTT